MHLTGSFGKALYLLPPTSYSLLSIQCKGTAFISNNSSAWGFTIPEVVGFCLQILVNTVQASGDIVEDFCTNWEVSHVSIDSFYVLKAREDKTVSLSVSWWLDNCWLDKLAIISWGIAITSLRKE